MDYFDIIYVNRIFGISIPNERNLLACIHLVLLANLNLQNVKLFFVKTSLATLKKFNCEACDMVSSKLHKVEFIIFDCRQKSLFYTAIVLFYASFSVIFKKNTKKYHFSFHKAPQIIIFFQMMLRLCSHHFYVLRALYRAILFVENDINQQIRSICYIFSNRSDIFNSVFNSSVQHTASLNPTLCLISVWQLL